jgi:hypothetical protein
MVARRALIVALLLVLPAMAGKKKVAPLVHLPPQTVELAALKLAAPAQKCTNYAWAVAVEAMLRAQDVALDQHFWVQKANGGELCIEPLPALDGLATVINGTYVLNDGRKVRVETRVRSGAPLPDDTIPPLRRNHPVLVFWRSRAYVLKAATYDEYIYPNAQRMFQIREMKLVDPLLRGPDAETTFVNGRDDPAEITGVVSIRVEPITPMSWQR